MKTKGVLRASSQKGSYLRPNEWMKMRWAGVGGQWVNGGRGAGCMFPHRNEL